MSIRVLSDKEMNVYTESTGRGKSGDTSAAVTPLI